MTQHNNNSDIINIYQDRVKKIIDKTHKRKILSFATHIKDAVIQNNLSTLNTLFNNNTPRKIKDVLSRQYTKKNFNHPKTNLMSIAIENNNMDILAFLLDQSIHLLKPNNINIFNEQIECAWQSIIAFDNLNALNTIKSYEIDIAQVVLENFEENQDIEPEIKESKKSLFFCFTHELKLEKTHNTTSKHYNYPYNLLKYFIETQHNNSTEKKANQQSFKKEFKKLSKESVVEQIDMVLDISIPRHFLQHLYEKEYQDMSFYIDECLELTKNGNTPENKIDLYNQLFINNVKDFIGTSFKMHSILGNIAKEELYSDKDHINKPHMKHFFHFLMLSFQDELRQSNFSIDSDYFFDIIGISKQEIKNYLNTGTDKTINTIPISIIYDIIGLEEEKYFLLQDKNLKKQHNKFLDDWYGLYLICSHRARSKFYISSYIDNHDFKNDDLIGLFIKNSEKHYKKDKKEILMQFFKRETNNAFLNKLITVNYNSIQKPRQIGEADSIENFIFNFKEPKEKIFFSDEQKNLIENSKKTVENSKLLHKIKDMTAKRTKNKIL